MTATAKTVLVTGATGSVGMNVCQKLLECGYSVVMLARHPPKEEEISELQKGPGKLSICLCDVLKETSIKEAILHHGVTDIIHSAAVTPGVESDLSQARSTIEINCIGTISVLNAALDSHLSGRFLMLGSISAYGKTALTESTLSEEVSVADPRVIYEISKFAAERIFLRYREAARLNGCVVRIGDVYGPWEHDSGVRPHMSLPYQAVSLAHAGKRAVFSRDYSGEWIYAPELAAAICSILEAPVLNYDVYPLSSGNRWKISEWCRCLKEKFPAFEYEHATDISAVNMQINQPTDNGAMSIQRLFEDTGFVMKYGLRESFTHYMKWLDNHPHYLDQ